MRTAARANIYHECKQIAVENTKTIVFFPVDVLRKALDENGFLIDKY